MFIVRKKTELYKLFNLKTHKDGGQNGALQNGPVSKWPTSKPAPEPQCPI